MRFSLVVLGVVAIGGVATAANVKKLQFSPDGGEALVLVEERDGLRGGSMTFVPVDLTTMTRGTVNIEVDKTTRGRLRTSDPGLQTKGEGLMVPKNMSRFSAAKGPAGTYALVGFSYNTGIGSAGACPADGAPLFRFEPGKANLVPAELLPRGGGSSNILAYSAARNGSNDDLGDAQKILNEYPMLRSTVVIAPIVGFVTFEDDKGRRSACSKGKKVVLVSQGTQQPDR
jgi:hypothetical protein